MTPECTTERKENRESFHTHQPHQDSHKLEERLHCFFSLLFSRELLLEIFSFWCIGIDYRQTSCWPQGYKRRVSLLTAHPAFAPDPQRCAAPKLNLGWTVQTNPKSPSWIQSNRSVSSSISKVYIIMKTKVQTSPDVLRRLVNFSLHLETILLCLDLLGN